MVISIPSLAWSHRYSASLHARSFHEALFGHGSGTIVLLRFLVPQVPVAVGLGMW